MQLPHLGIIPDEWEHHLEHFLEPVVGFGEADITNTWADDHLVLLLILAIVCSLVGIVIAWLIYQKQRIKAFEPKLFAAGWYYDTAITWFMGNPGRKGFEATAAFDANGHRRCGQRDVGRRPGDRERGPQGRDGLRPAVRIDHRHRRGAAARLVRRHPGDHLMLAAGNDRQLSGSRSSPPSSSCRSSARCSSPCHRGRDPTSPRCWPCSRRWPPPHSPCGCSPRSRPATPVTSSSRSTRGSSRGGSRGTSVSTASRCSSWCSPVCCSRWRSSASTRTMTSGPIWRGC